MQYVRMTIMTHRQVLVVGFEGMDIENYVRSSGKIFNYQNCVVFKNSHDI